MNVRPPIAIPICRDTFFSCYSMLLSEAIEHALPFLVKVVMRRQYYLEAKMPSDGLTLLYLSKSCVQDGLTWLSGVLNRRVELEDIGGFGMEVFISHLETYRFYSILTDTIYVSYEINGNRMMHDILIIDYENRRGRARLYGENMIDFQIPEDIRDSTSEVEINGVRFRWITILRAFVLYFLGLRDARYEDRKAMTINLINEALLDRSDNVLSDINVPQVRRIIIHANGKMDVEYVSKSEKDKKVRLCFFSARRAYFSLAHLRKAGYGFLLTVTKGGDSYRRIYMFFIRPDGVGVVKPLGGEPLSADSIRLLKRGIRVELGGDTWIRVVEYGGDLCLALYFASDKPIGKKKAEFIDLPPPLSNALINKFFPNL